MKLCIFHRDFCSSALQPRDGAKQFSSGIASGGTTLGTETVVVCIGTKDETRECDGYTVKCFAGTGTLPFTPPDRLKAFFREQSKDTVVLMIGMFVPHHYPLSRFLRAEGIPYVVSPLDPYNPAVFRQRAHLKWPYWHLFERRLLQGASAIQLLDIRHEASLHQLGIRTPAFETAVGYPSSLVPDATDLRWRTEGIPRLVYLGRIDPLNKGLDLLIDAVAEVKKVRPVSLVIQGPGYQTEPMNLLEQQVKRLDLTDTVTFLPPDYTRSAAAIFGEHDLYCEPSRYNGFGIGTMEAMLAGRPVLVSDDQGIAPHVRASNGGITVPLSVPSIAQGILSLIEQREHWKELGMKGRRYVLETLQWRAIVPRAIEDLQNILQPVRTLAGSQAARN